MFQLHPKEIMGSNELIAPAAPKSGPEGTARVRCSTTKGDFTLTLYRSWAPIGYDRFIELIEKKFLDDQLLYRVIPGFLVQFGIPSDPSKVKDSPFPAIKDDVDLKIPFQKGTLSFAGSGADSRTFHLFIANEPHGNGLGGALHERPFGQILDVEEQNVIDRLFTYGDIAGKQHELLTKGNKEFLVAYPRLDRINSCEFI